MPQISLGFRLGIFVKAVPDDILPYAQLFTDYFTKPRGLLSQWLLQHRAIWQPTETHCKHKSCETSFTHNLSLICQIP